MRSILPTLVFLVISVWPAFGQLGAAKPAAVSDPRVQKVLDQAGLKSSVDGDGDYRMNNEVPDGRSQLVWILSNTSKLGSLEIREVWSIAYKSPKPFSAELANRLLNENCKTKVGSWQMQKMGEDFVAVFSAKIAAETDSASLATIIDAVAKTADKMEQEISTGDDL